MINIKTTLETLYLKYKDLKEGSTADYIPELSKANPNDFGMAIVTKDGESFQIGDCHKNFTLQSTSKPFVYGLALETLGRNIELEEHTHRPYNPMINSGAIAISSLIKASSYLERENKILNHFESYVGHSLSINQVVFESEKKTGYRNRAIANLLRHFNIIEGDQLEIEQSLDLYFKQCSIMVNTVDLALMAATLSNNGIQPLTKNKIINPETSSDMLSLMFSCGMYDTAGEWAYTVGLPAKSGVSGGLIAVVPGVMGIAVYSPLIDHHGHSIRAVNVLKELSKIYSLSIFSSGAR